MTSLFLFNPYCRNSANHTNSAFLWCDLGFMSGVMRGCRYTRHDMGHLDKIGAPATTVDSVLV